MPKKIHSVCWGGEYSCSDDLVALTIMPWLTIISGNLKGAYMLLLLSFSNTVQLQGRRLCTDHN